MTVVTHYTNPTVMIETPDGVSDNGKDEEAAIGGGGTGGPPAGRPVGALAAVGPLALARYRTSTGALSVTLLGLL